MFTTLKSQSANHKLEHLTELNLVVCKKTTKPPNYQTKIKSPPSFLQGHIELLKACKHGVG